MGHIGHESFQGAHSAFSQSVCGDASERALPANKASDVHVHFFVVGSLVMSYYTVYRLMALIILFAALVLKVHIEESLLENHYENYRLYKKKTFRFFPFLY